MDTALEPAGPPQENQEEEEEEEEVFYAFVILHARQDYTTALRLKEKIEIAANCEGATFTEDFCIPGKQTLTCVEDAIKNSAFSFLLLTTHFNTSRLKEVETNIALMNSINKQHKFNTVIPLLPEKTTLEPQNLMLESLIPLEEKNEYFNNQILSFMKPAAIKKQRKIWKEERRSITNILNMSLEERGGARGGAGAGGGASSDPNQPSIFIQNAENVIIGNDSHMVVSTPH